jgi:ribosomal protein S27E
VPILMKCGCGQQMRVVDEQAGRKVKCPGCGDVLNVPKAPEPAKAAATTTPAVLTFKCDQCGKAMQARAEHAGKLAQCPGCAAKVRIPKPGVPDVEEVEEVTTSRPAKKARAAAAVEEAAIAQKPIKKAKAAVADVPDVEEVEDLGDDDRPKKKRVVDEDEDDRPKKKRRDDDEDDDDRPKKKKKKKAAARGGMMLWLLLGGGALALLLLVGGGLTLWLVFGGSSDDLKFVTDDCNQFVSVRMADVYGNSKIPSSAKEEMEKQTEKFGLKPSEIERLTVAQATGKNPEDNYSWTILLTTSSVDQKKVQEKVVGSGAKEVTSNGKKYFQSSKDDFLGKPCVYFHGSKIVVITDSEKTMEKVLSGYPRKKSDGPVATGVKKASGSKYQLVVAASIKKETSGGMGFLFGGGGDAGLEGVVVAASLSGSKVSGDVTVTFTSESKAKEARDQMEKGRKEALDNKNLSDKERSMIRGVSVSASGKDLKVSGSFDIDDTKGAFNFGKNPFGGF